MVRRRNSLSRALRAARHYVNDHAAPVLLLLLALLALVAAIWRQWVRFD